MKINKVNLLAIVFIISACVPDTQVPLHIKNTEIRNIVPSKEPLGNIIAPIKELVKENNTKISIQKNGRLRTTGIISQVEIIDEKGFRKIVNLGRNNTDNLSINEGKNQVIISIFDKNNDLISYEVRTIVIEKNKNIDITFDLEHKTNSLKIDIPSTKDNEIFLNNATKTMVDIIDSAGNIDTFTLDNIRSGNVNVPIGENKIIIKLFDSKNSLLSTYSRDNLYITKEKEIVEYVVFGSNIIQTSTNSGSNIVTNPVRPDPIEPIEVEEICDALQIKYTLKKCKK